MDWEGALITQDIYNNKSRTVKYVPVLFSDDHHQFIPEPIGSASRYVLTSDVNYQALYDFLLGQAGVEPGEVGEPKHKPRAKGQPLTFDDDGDASILFPHPSIPHPSIKISLPPPLTPHLFGRDDELQLLDEAWAKSDNQDRRLSCAGWASGQIGAGQQVAGALMAKRNYDGARRVFGWSFFSQGSSETQSATSESFIDDALQFFGDPDPAEGISDKANRLAKVLRAQRTVLVLDGLEPLQ